MLKERDEICCVSLKHVMTLFSLEVRTLCSGAALTVIYLVEKVSKMACVHANCTGMWDPNVGFGLVLILSAIFNLVS